MDSQSSWDWSAAGSTSGAQHTEHEEGVKHRVQTEQPSGQSASSSTGHSAQSRRSRTYGPRTCRICLEVEQPRYQADAGSTFGISNASSRPTYRSDDSDLGRLLSPCKCKGSQKYVHEGCLDAWRTANPTERRNYWQCPTCGFKYRLARIRRASLVSSWFVRVSLSVAILLLSILILGVVADPILDLWFDPWSTIVDTVTGVITNIEADDLQRDFDDYYYYNEPETWTDRFLKGFYSLGIIGFIKSAFVVSPWHWWNLRGLLGGGGGRRQGTGRSRMENMSIVFVVIGAFTFFMAIWKFVNAMIARFLKQVSDRVLDVAEDEDDNDNDTTS